MNKRLVQHAYEHYYHEDGPVGPHQLVAWGRLVESVAVALTDEWCEYAAEQARKAGENDPLAGWIGWAMGMNAEFFR